MQLVHQARVDKGFPRPSLHFDVNIGSFLIAIFDQRISVDVVGIRIVCIRVHSRKGLVDGFQCRGLVR